MTTNVDKTIALVTGANEGIAKAIALIIHASPLPQG
jgi:NADP-dependent 3-hydroxy acid dehydrogenase YdfG